MADKLKPVINLADVPLRDNAHGEDFAARIGSFGGMIGSTGIGSAVAIPHCKMKGLERAILAVGLKERPVDFGAVDEITRYTTESLIAVPIRIEQEVCGVLELINRRGMGYFNETDRNLLEIFAGYISISIQNVRASSSPPRGMATCAWCSCISASFRTGRSWCRGPLQPRPPRR